MIPDVRPIQPDGAGAALVRNLRVARSAGLGAAVQHRAHPAGGLRAGVPGPGATAVPGAAVGPDPLLGEGPDLGGSGR